MFLSRKSKWLRRSTITADECLNKNELFWPQIHFSSYLTSSDTIPIFISYYQSEKDLFYTSHKSCHRHLKVPKVCLFFQEPSLLSDSLHSFITHWPIELNTYSVTSDNPDLDEFIGQNYIDICKWSSSNPCKTKTELYELWHQRFIYALRSLKILDGINARYFFI